jgi:hypothetical protein
MNELAPGVIHARRNPQTGLWRFRVVGCGHAVASLKGIDHGTLREAERCASSVLEKREAPPKTERTG